MTPHSTQNHRFYMVDVIILTEKCLENRLTDKKVRQWSTVKFKKNEKKFFMAKTRIELEIS